MTRENIIKYFEDNNMSGCELLFDDTSLLKLFFKVVYWRNQFIYTKGLYVEKFIPSCEILDKELELELNQNDNYGLEINIDNVSSVQETIRFGYIALYHKYESFSKEYMLLLTQYYSKSKEELISIFKENLNIKIIKPDKGIIYKFSWVSDCVKHQDAIASLKNNPPSAFVNYPQNRKIIISPQQFSIDTNKLVQEFDKIIKGTFLTMFMVEGGVDNANVSKILKNMFD